MDEISASVFTPREQGMGYRAEGKERGYSRKVGAPCGGRGSYKYREKVRSLLTRTGMYVRH